MLILTSQKLGKNYGRNNRKYINEGVEEGFILLIQTIKNELVSKKLKKIRKSMRIVKIMRVLLIASIMNLDYMISTKKFT